MQVDRNASHATATSEVIVNLTVKDNAKTQA